MPISSRSTYFRTAHRAAFFVLLLILVLLWVSCGETYRPIATPIPSPGGDPKNQHFAVVVSNGTPPADGGAAVIDVAADTNVSNRQAGVNPIHAAISPPAGSLRAWVVNQGDNSVSSFFPSSLSVPDLTLNLESGAGPTYIDVSATIVCVTETALNRVAILNNTSAVATAFVGVGNNPVALAVRPDGNKCYVANKNDGTVSVVSVPNAAITGSPIAVGTAPVAMAMQTAGNFVYVVSQGGNSLSVIDTTLDAEVQRLTGLSAPFQVIWDNNLQRVYVLNGGASSVSIYNAATPSTLTLLRTVSLAVSPIAMAVLDNATKFYVLYGGSPGTVGVYDAQSFALRTTLTVQNDPRWIAASPGAEKVFVANRLGDAGATTPQFPNGSISIIKTQADTVSNIAPAQPNPVFVAAQ